MTSTIETTRSRSHQRPPPHPHTHKTLHTSCTAAPEKLDRNPKMAHI